MKKTITLNIETQTEDKNIITLCHINQKTISLEISNIAKVMFQRNRQLFDKINNSTKLIGGVLYRQEVETPKENVNRLGTPMLNSYAFKEKEISQLFFEDNILTPQVRAISKSGYKFDYDPKTVSNENQGGAFDPKKPSLDDIEESQKICTVEEIGLFQNQGIKTIMITDTLDDVKDILEVGYRMDISVDTDFKEFVDYVMKQAEKSLLFLASYSQLMNLKTNYDSAAERFTDDFVKNILEGLGINNTGTSNLATKRIKDSEFGQVALSFYNMSLLLSSAPSGKEYSDILRILLPTNKTSPEVIDRFISDFSALFNIVSREYKLNTKQTKKEGNKYSRISEGKAFNNIISATTIEKIEVEQEKLGYSVFSEEVSGLNKFSSSGYSQRVGLERSKYYPSMDISDTSKFLTPSERSEFSNMSNASAFLTPLTLVMGEEKIGTSRGMKNIDIKKIRQFRLAKSSRMQQKKSTKRPISYSRAKVEQDNISSFNVMVATPRTALLERSVEQNIEPLTDCKHYLSEGSFFVTENPLVLLKQFKRIQRENDKKILGIVSDVVPRRFLRDRKAIKSVKEIRFSNPNSRVRKLARTKELAIKDIPPHVKFMMSDSFSPNPNSDPLKNSESREIIEETQKNLFLIKALVGFESDSDGFLDIRAPIYEPINSVSLGPDKMFLAKAFHYEIPELGIVKDNFAGTIYSNLAYIRG